MQCIRTIINLFVNHKPAASSVQYIITPRDGELSSDSGESSVPTTCGCCVLLQPQFSPSVLSIYSLFLQATASAFCGSDGHAKSGRFLGNSGKKQALQLNCMN